MMCGDSGSDSAFSEASESEHSESGTLSEESGWDGQCSQHGEISDLPDNVEVGDVVEIVGLISDQGKKMNGYYAKVKTWCEKTKRFGIDFRGKLVAIRPENLNMGMKADEMSASDEDMLLRLEPATAEVKVLPWKERVKRLVLLREK